MEIGRAQAGTQPTYLFLVSSSGIVTRSEALAPIAQSLLSDLSDVHIRSTQHDPPEHIGSKILYFRVT